MCKWGEDVDPTKGLLPWERPREPRETDGHADHVALVARDAYHVGEVSRPHCRRVLSVRGALAIHGLDARVKDGDPAPGTCSIYLPQLPLPVCRLGAMEREVER